MLKTNSTIFVSSLMIVLFVSACSSPKRGFVFRGDWAFEYNRTPWIGHPGNTDIPGTESNKTEGDKDSKKKICPVCKQEKEETSWKDILLGPFAKNKEKKCLCDRLHPGGGITGGNPYGGNINITSYNPTVANTFPGAFGGGYPGTVPPGSLSLPPGAVVVPNGVLLPNGTLLPQSLFFPQAAGVTGVSQNAAQNIAQNTAQNGVGNTVMPTSPNAVPPQPQLVPNAINAKELTPQGQVIPGQAAPNPQNGTAAPQVPNGIPAGTPPPTLQLTPNATPNSEQAALLQMQSIVPGLSGAGANLGVNAQTAPMPASGSLLAPAAPWQNAQNPMLVNPVTNQVVPGLSMTGTQAPGYPPIGYVPTGYASGYAQPMVAPMPGGNPLSAAATAKTARNDSGEEEESDDESAEASKTAARRQTAQMPYPRFYPVPTRPAFQRSMGMAPDYAALQPPRNQGMSPILPPQMMQPQMMNPMMSPMMQQQMMWQQQLLMQQQMMMRQQQMAYAQQMQQRLAAMSPNTSSNVSSNRVAQRTTATANRQVSMLPDDEESAVVSASDNPSNNRSDNQAPMPPKSKVILANQQSDILQDTPPPVSRTTQVNLTQTKKSKQQ